MSAFYQKKILLLFSIILTASSTVHPPPDHPPPDHPPPAELLNEIYKRRCSKTMHYVRKK
jgi:hypothetical protein